MSEKINPGTQLEIAIDGILDEGVLQDIPAVGTVVRLMKFGNSMNQYFFVKKIYKFLFQLNEISIEDRRKKINQINKSGKYQSKVGNSIIELLDKIDSDYLPEIIGKLFKSVIEEKISYQEYLKLAHIVKTCFYYDLLDLSKKRDGNKLIGSVSDHLYTLGLATTDFADAYNDRVEGGVIKDSYSFITPLGIQLIENGMN